MVERNIRGVRPLRFGDRGREVVDLQTRLQALGYELGERGVDGVFRGDTEEAVRSFQRTSGIRADGVVGAITWRELVESFYRPGDRLLYFRQPAFRGADVTELQRMLNDLGFDPGSVNGLFDGRTAAAVREFQRNAGLVEDGVVDETTFKMLGIYASQTLGTHQFPDKHGGYMPEDLFSGAVVLDAARGGRDRGYEAGGSVCEADLNLAVILELAGLLPAREVLLTRTGDYDVSYSDRAFLANASGAAMVISVRHAAHHTPAACGTASFYFERLGYVSHRGRMAATYVQHGVSKALGTCDIGEFGRSYELLRETNMPAVLVEPLFLSNPHELEIATDPSYPAALARAIADSLKLYAGRDASFISRR